MIKLDVNLKYLTDNYNIGSQQLQAYKNKSLQEIMKLEAKNGNSKAAEFNLNLLSDPMELVRIFRLMDAENRYQIIKNMNYNDKLKLLSMLEIGEMLLGLEFFQKDKLLNMMRGLKKEKLFAVAMQKYSFDDFMKMIPEKEQNKFFDQKKITPAQILKGVQHLEANQMARMLENVTGESQQGKSKKELMASLVTLKPEALRNSVKSLEQDEKAFVMSKMAKEDPSVLNELSTDAFIAPLEQLDKEDLVKAMGVLDPEDMMTMLSELPEDLIAVTASQIDPEKLSRMLVTEFTDVLSQLGANI